MNLSRQISKQYAPEITSAHRRQQLLTPGLLLRESRVEFYREMNRRKEIIRFGKYEGSWTEKNNTDKNKRVFPIPQTAIDGASNLPNYLVQNEGY